MTSIRFVGELPLWLGLCLAIVVAALSWRYYRRESVELSARLKWLLPLLRSAAFFLGVMVLTGPVLQHRQVIGELGQVKIYFDASESMAMQDRHMSTGRKLLLGEQLGWLGEGKLDASLFHAADRLRNARRKFVQRITEQDPSVDLAAESTERSAAGNRTTVDHATVKAARDQFVSDLLPVPDLLGDSRRTLAVGGEAAVSSNPSFAARLSAELVEPLAGVAIPESTEGLSASITQLLSIADRSGEIERQVASEFESLAETLLNSQDQSIQAVVTQIDESPRWRRCELELFDSRTSVYAELCQRHDVQLFLLSAGEAIVRDAIMPDDSTASSNPYVFTENFSTQTDLSSGVVATQHGIVTLKEPDTESREPQTAVVLFSDGQHNLGPSPLQTARVLGRQGVAFYCVSMGASKSAPDLAVIGLEHPPMVFRKDKVRGVMVVRDRMPAGQPFVAQIRYGTDVLWQQQLRTRNEMERRIEFEFTVDELVERIGSQFDSDLVQNTLPLPFEASVTSLAGENETGNNQRTMRLAVVTQRNRVLIIDGRARWETRYLRNAFERDDKWRVNTLIAGSGADGESLSRGNQDGQFPDTRDALFKYDLVIMGEIQPDLFTEPEQLWLREFVEIRGGGMIFVDGQRGYLRQWADRQPGPLLPVELSADPLTEKPTSLKLTSKGATISALMLQLDKQDNVRFWTELPVPRSMANAKALPGSEVLVEADVAGRSCPAMVTRMCGAGRVLYLAFDETWRWRYKVADTWHQRIWNQLARFVMPRPFAVSGEYLSIDTGAICYDPGDTVSVRIRLLGLDGKPCSVAIADALVSMDGKVVSKISLKPDPEVPGIYRGQFSGLEHGAYEVSIQASGYSESALKARSKFVVLPAETGELDETAANESLLKQMAEQSGGVYLREEEVNQLPELLSPLSSGRVIESETPLWQSYWWFTSIILLLSIEWLLRKRAGLL